MDPMNNTYYYETTEKLQNCGLCRPETHHSLISPSKGGIEN